MEHDGTWLRMHFPECFTLTKYLKWLSNNLRWTFVWKLLFYTIWWSTLDFLSFRSPLQHQITNVYRFDTCNNSNMENNSRPKRSSVLVHFEEPIPTRTPGNHRAICKHCSTPVCGSIKATWNFKRHLQVSSQTDSLLFWKPSLDGIMLLIFDTISVGVTNQECVIHIIHLKKQCMTLLVILYG